MSEDAGCDKTTPEDLVVKYIGDSAVLAGQLTVEQVDEFEKVIAKRVKTVSSQNEGISDAERTKKLAAMLFLIGYWSVVAIKESLFVNCRCEEN